MDIVRVAAGKEVVRFNGEFHHRLSGGIHILVRLNLAGNKYMYVCS